MRKFYREFTCVVCGRKAIDRGRIQNAKLCSDKCRNKYYYRNPGGNIKNKTFVSVQCGRVL